MYIKRDTDRDEAAEVIVDDVDGVGDAVLRHRIDFLVGSDYFVSHCRHC